MEDSGALSFGSGFGVGAACVLGTAALGVMGTTGTTGFVGVRMCVEDVAGLDAGAGLVIVGGVVGIVESASEGAMDVAGVSRSERAVTVDDCESVCSSVTSPLSTGWSGSFSPAVGSCICSSVRGRAGSSRAAPGSATDLTLRRR